MYAEWIDECDAVNKDGADVDDEDGLDAGLRRGGDDDEEDDGYDREQHTTQDDDWRQDDADT